MKDDAANRKRINETKIIQYLAYKGFSPSQIRHLCVRLLKMDMEITSRKVHNYVSKDWIRKAETRFFREHIMKELKRLGYIE